MELENALHNTKHYKGKIELVVTHTCPQSFLSPLSELINISHKIHDENPYKLEKIKNTLIDNNQKPQFWLFGHWHRDVNFTSDEIESNGLYLHCLKLDENKNFEQFDFRKEIFYAKTRNRHKE